LLHQFKWSYRSVIQDYAIIAMQGNGHNLIVIDKDTVNDLGQ